MSNRFYHNGLFYDDEGCFFKAVEHYAKSQISPVSAQRILEDMVRHIVINIFAIVNDKHLSNAEFSALSEALWIDFLQKYNQKREDNDH